MQCSGFFLLANFYREMKRYRTTTNQSALGNTATCEAEDSFAACVYLPVKGEKNPLICLSLGPYLQMVEEK